MGPPEPTLLSDQFGPLQGVRILSTGTIVAEPVAAGMAAEMGAEVIHIERPGKGEDWRVASSPLKLPTGIWWPVPGYRPQITATPTTRPWIWPAQLEGREHLERPW